MDELERKEKRWNKKRAYLDDFTQNVAGEYIYTGKIHAFCEEGTSRKKAMGILWLLTGAMAVLSVLSGCLPAAGMQNTFYVLIPYAGSLLSVVSVIWAMCRLSSEGEPVRDFIYKATVEQFKPRGTLAVVFTAATILAELLYLILNKGAGGMWPGTIVFLAAQAALLAAALFWRRRALGMHWKADQ